MAKAKNIKISTQLISVRLPETLVSRLNEFVNRRLLAKNESVLFNRSMAIQELLNEALEAKENADG